VRALTWPAQELPGTHRKPPTLDAADRDQAVRSITVLAAGRQMLGTNDIFAVTATSALAGFAPDDTYCVTTTTTVTAVNRIFHPLFRLSANQQKNNV
jgi:hypothetical protein